MKPLKLIRKRGFLLRVVHNGSSSHPYEWTVDGYTPATRAFIRSCHERTMRHMKQTRWMHPLRKRVTDPEMLMWYYQKRRLGNMLKRVYDPTSMPTAYGRCSAQDYGMNEVTGMLYEMTVKPEPYVWYHKPRRTA